MKTHITNYQEVNSDKVIGEKIEIPEGELFVLNFGSSKFSFLNKDEGYEDDFLTIEDHIEREDNYWLFDGDDESDYNELDYALFIESDGETFDKRRDFSGVEDSAEGIYLIEMAIYESADSENVFVIISMNLEGEEKEVSYFKAEKY